MKISEFPIFSAEKAPERSEFRLHSALKSVHNDEVVDVDGSEYDQTSIENKIKAEDSDADEQQEIDYQPPERYFRLDGESFLYFEHANNLNYHDGPSNCQELEQMNSTNKLEK